MEIYIYIVSSFLFPIVSLGCGSLSSENCTYLVQASSTTLDDNPCGYTICPCGQNICRLRLDFAVRAH